MDLTIYEDQTGLMLFPEEKLEKNNKVVNFFNNNVDLYIQKVGNNLTIYCHLIAHKAATRPLGYYVICQCRDGKNTFSDFKKGMNDVLKILELQPRYGHIDNVIFENIEKFDNRNIASDSLRRDIDKFAKVHRRLEYNGGDISQISAFCGYALENIDKVEILISANNSEFGDINILLNKKYADPLKKISNVQYGAAVQDVQNVKRVQDVKRVQNVKRVPPKNIQGYKSDKDINIDDVTRETNNKFFKIAAVIVLLSMIMVSVIYVKNDYSLPNKEEITKIKDYMMTRFGPKNVAITDEIQAINNSEKNESDANASSTKTLAANSTSVPIENCTTFKPGGDCFSSPNGLDENVSVNITGFVLGADNKGVRDIPVKLYLNNAGIEKSLTDKSGFYILENIEGGIYDATIDVKGIIYNFTIDVKGGAYNITTNKIWSAVNITKDENNTNITIS